MTSERSKKVEMQVRAGHSCNGEILNYNLIVRLVVSVVRRWYAVFFRSVLMLKFEDHGRR